MVSLSHNELNLANVPEILVLTEMTRRNQSIWSSANILLNSSSLALSPALNPQLLIETCVCKQSQVLMCNAANWLLVLCRHETTVFNSLALGRFEWNFRLVIFQDNFIDWLLRCLWWNCPPMNVTGHYWWWVNIGSGNGAIRQQAITWASVDPDLCPHMVSLSHNELNLANVPEILVMTEMTQRSQLIWSSTNILLNSYSLALCPALNPQLSIETSVCKQSQVLMCDAANWLLVLWWHETTVFNSFAPGRFEWNFRLVIFQANFIDWWLRCFWWNCPQMNVSGHYWWWVNIGSGNGLVTSGTKPLPGPVLTYIYVLIWCQ